MGTFVHKLLFSKHRSKNDSARFRRFRGIFINQNNSDYKFVEIFCTWVRKLKKLHFFWRTISWKIWRFQISRKKFIRQKRVAELVSLLPCNLETRDRNAGEATFPFFLFSLFLYIFTFTMEQEFFKQYLARNFNYVICNGSALQSLKVRIQ